MTNDEAIRILDPETSHNALVKMMGGRWYQPRAMELLQEAQRMGLQALRAQQNGGCISVNDRLPPTNKKVLVWFSGNKSFDPQCLMSFRCSGEEGIMYQREFGIATHWQPLPEPQKGG